MQACAMLVNVSIFTLERVSSPLLPNLFTLEEREKGQNACGLRQIDYFSIRMSALSGAA